MTDCPSQFDITIDGTAISMKAEDKTRFTITCPRQFANSRGNMVLLLMNKLFVQKGYSEARADYDQWKQTFTLKPTGDDTKAAHYMEYIDELKDLLQEVKEYAEQINPDSQSPNGYSAGFNYVLQQIPEVPTERIISPLEIASRNANLLTEKQIKQAIGTALAEHYPHPSRIAPLTDSIMAKVEVLFQEAMKLGEPFKEQAIRTAIRSAVHKDLAEMMTLDLEDQASKVMQAIYKEMRAEKSRRAGMD